MSNVAANSIFPRQDQLNLFTSLYVAWRHSNGTGSSQPSSSGPPVLAPPPMRSMSARNLCANSRQALPGTDDGASQPADLRDQWPGLWRLTPEWRKIVAPSYTVQASPCRKRPCTQTSIQTCIPTGSTQRSRGKRQCRRQAVTTTQPRMTSADDKGKLKGTAQVRSSRVPVSAMGKPVRKGVHDNAEIKARKAAAEAWDKRYYANLQPHLKQRGSSEEARRTVSDAVLEIRNGCDAVLEIRRRKRQCRRPGVTTSEPTRVHCGPREAPAPITSDADEKCRPSSPWRQWKPTGTAHLPCFRRVRVCAARRCAWTGQYGSSEVANAGAEAWDRKYYANLQPKLKQPGSSEEPKSSASDAVIEI